MVKGIKIEVKISKVDAVKFLADVPEDKVFWVVDGRILKNMAELQAALAVMTDETFAYHNNAVKKDFSTWVRDVMGDAKLTQDLEKATGRTQAANLVQERIAHLTRLCK
jgi:hypothetical protein